ncbi:MAG: sel1 repeat family protein [Elusimicrobiales bacterium]|nr:sel1 repeat family protein [Elusimicrobiales bacterium]
MEKIKDILISLMDKLSLLGVLLKLLKVISVILVFAFYISPLFLLSIYKDNPADMVRPYCLFSIFVLIFSFVVNGANARRARPQKNIEAVKDKYLRFIVCPFLETVDLYEKIPLFVSMMGLLFYGMFNEKKDGVTLAVMGGVFFVMFLINFFNEILLTMATAILRISERIEENEHKAFETFDLRRNEIRDNPDYDPSLAYQETPIAQSQAEPLPKSMPTMPKPPMPPQRITTSADIEIVDAGAKGKNVNSEEKNNAGESPRKTHFKGIVAIVLVLAILGGAAYYFLNAKDPYIECDKYFNGKGVEKDYNKAFKWCGKSANLGNAEAQFYLGQMYLRGKGTEENEEKGFELYEKAAHNGNKDAENALINAALQIGDSYYNGYNDYNHSAEWYEKAAAFGNLKASQMLAEIYYDKLKDYGKAAKWVIPLAEKDDADAQMRLGGMYYNGNGVEQSCEKALSWNKKAAENGNRFAPILEERYLCDSGKCFDEAECNKLRRASFAQFFGGFSN